jgi:hypothetical protein
MFLDDQRIEEGPVDPEKIWSAIRYLDPDQTHSAGGTAIMVALLALVILVCAVWGLLWLKVAEP